MDVSGKIYSPEEISSIVNEEIRQGLINIPQRELSTVKAMSEVERRAWYQAKLKRREAAKRAKKSKRKNRR